MLTYIHISQSLLDYLLKYFVPLLDCLCSILAILSAKVFFCMQHAAVRWRGAHSQGWPDFTNIERTSR